MGINAFQTTAFQQTAGHVAFQELTGPSVTLTGGRYVSEKEVKDEKPWRYKSGITELYRQKAAIALGHKGGIAYANALRQKPR